MTRMHKGLMFLALVTTLSALIGCNALAQPRVSEEAANAALERMSVLCRAETEEKAQELVDEFKDTDFSKWPRAADAFYYRGVAYKFLKDADKAERDLKTSVKLAPKEGWFWYNLGGTYDRLRNDPARAVEAYAKAVESEDRAGWMPVAAATRATTILLNQVKPEEATKILALFDDETLERMSPRVRTQILATRGRTLAAQGREEEAWAAFRRRR